MRSFAKAQNQYLKNNTQASQRCKKKNIVRSLRKSRARGSDENATNEDASKSQKKLKFRNVALGGCLKIKHFLRASENANRNERTFHAEQEELLMG